MTSDVHQTWLTSIGLSQAVLQPLARGRNSAWRVETPDGPLILKQPHTAKRFRAERAALEAVADLSGTPSLVAASEADGLLLMTVLPGAVRRRVSGHMLVEAGGFLRQLHALPLAESRPADPQPLLKRTARAAAQAAGAVDDAIIDRITAQVRDHADVVGPAVRIHGDFCARNWVWDALRRQLGVIDWELSREGSAFVDYARLGQGLRDADFRRVFFSACGRRLSAEEDTLVDGLCGVELLVGLGQAVAADRRHLLAPLRAILEGWR